jgi:hypothetical protein
MAIDLVRRYREQGDAALPTYNDEHEPADVRSLMERFRALSLAPPETTALMLEYPHVAGGHANIQSIFYWERVVFGLKPTLRVTHLVASQPPSGVLSCVVAIKQLYASHYIRAAIDYAACVTASERRGQQGFYLVAFKGSRQEGVTGLTGSLVRRIVVGRARTALDGSLIRIKRALEASSSDPRPPA